MRTYVRIICGILSAHNRAHIIILGIIHTRIRKLFVPYFHIFTEFCSHFVHIAQARAYVSGVVLFSPRRRGE